MKHSDKRNNPALRLPNTSTAAEVTAMKDSASLTSNTNTDRLGNLNKVDFVHTLKTQATGMIGLMFGNKTGNIILSIIHTTKVGSSLTKKPIILRG